MSLTPTISPSVISRVLRRSAERRTKSVDVLAPPPQREPSDGLVLPATLSDEGEEQEPQDFLPTPLGPNKRARAEVSDSPEQAPDPTMLLLCEDECANDTDKNQPPCPKRALVETLVVDDDGGDVPEGSEGDTTKRALMLDGSAKKAPRSADEDERVSVSGEFVGFSTGKNKRGAPSAESLKKAAALMRDGEEDPVPPPPPVEEAGAFGGFSTGKNKRVAPSAESLKKAAALMRDGDDDPAPPPPPPLVGEEGAFGGFSTGKNKRVAPSAESLKKAAALMRDGDDDPAPPPPPPLVGEEGAFGGFSTGKNKRVAPSAESLKKAAALMEDDCEKVSPKTQMTQIAPSSESAPRAQQSMKLVEEAGRDDEFKQEKQQGNPRVLKKLLNFSEEDEVAVVPKLSVAQQAALATPLSRSKTVATSAGKSFSTPRTKPFQAPSRNGNTPATPMGKRAMQTSSAEGSSSSKSVMPRPVATAATVVAAPVSASPLRKSLLDFNGAPELKSYSEEDYLRMGVRDSTQNMTFEMAAGFRFDRGATGPEWFRAELLKDGAVKEELLSLEWVENHYALIVWKLASMERAFPGTLGAVYLTKLQVLKQLQARYAVETGGVHRPIFRKIAERDDVATRYMVVVVTRVIDLGEDCPALPAAPPKLAEGEEMDEKTAGLILASFATIEVSDGWYVMRAKLDAKLTEHLAMGRIFPGLKLRVCGARLQGVTEACPVLELPEGAFLALSVNGCRRAKWHARLGLKLSPPFPVSIKSVQAGGGTIPRLDLVILRVMPLLFMEKDEETGRWSSHDSKAEAEAQERIQAAVAATSAACAEEMRAEFDREDAQRRQSGRRLGAHQLQYERNEEVLYSAYLFNPSLLEGMTEPQQALVLRLERRIEEERSSAIQAEVQSLTEKAQAKRQVTPFVELEVADCPMEEVADRARIGYAVVQVYSPDGELLENVLREGKLVSVFGLEAPKTRPDDLGRPRLKSGKMTMWKERVEEAPIALYKEIYSPRACLPLVQLSTATPDMLFDWFGCVLQIAPFGASTAELAMFFFADGSGNGMALAVEGPPSFKVNYETRGELAQVHLRNLSYKLFDEHLRLHVAVCSSRTELLKISAADSAKLTETAEAIAEVNQRMQHFVEFSGQVSVNASFYSSKLVAAIQPLGVAVFSPLTASAACVPTWGDLLVSDALGSEQCGKCQRALVGSVYRPSLTGIAVCLDDGVNSYLCTLSTRCLTTMLAVRTPAIVELHNWLQVLERTGRCIGRDAEEQEEFLCFGRQKAFRSVKAGELALPSTVIALLLNCSVSSTEDLCSHDQCACSLVTPLPIVLRPKERATLLGLLWAALASKRWAFTVARATSGSKKHVAGWKDVYGDVESVAPLVECRWIAQLMMKAWDVEFK
jgi:hypothetical protein